MCCCFWGGLKRVFYSFQDGYILKNEIIPAGNGNVAMNHSHLLEAVVKNCSGSTDECQTSSGVKLSDISVWDKVLTTDGMVDWTNCRF